MLAYAFTRLTADALPLVHEWLDRPHVVEWWPDAEVQSAQIEAHVEGDDTTPYLVSLDGRPFAYLQCSQLTDDTLGLDQFIAEDALLGRGHGSGFIRQFCARGPQASLQKIIRRAPVCPVACLKEMPVASR